MSLLYSPYKSSVKSSGKWRSHNFCVTLEDPSRNVNYIPVSDIQESFSRIASTVLKTYNHPDWTGIIPILNNRELLILKISELDKKIEHMEAFLILKMPELDKKIEHMESLSELDKKIEHLEALSESRNVMYELD